MRHTTLLACWRCRWVRADVHPLAAFPLPARHFSKRARSAAERRPESTARQTAPTAASPSKHRNHAAAASSQSRTHTPPSSPSDAPPPSTSVLSWGAGAFGGLGCSSYHPHPTPTVIPTLASLPSPVTSLASGWTHNIAITAAGEVFSWGYKPFVRSLSLTAKLHNRVPSLLASLQSLNLGRFTLSNANTTPTAVPSFGSTMQAVSASCGGDYAAIVTSDQRLLTVGSGFFGQLGRSPSIADTMTSEPREVTRLTEEGVAVKAVSCGFHHMLVLADDGSVYVCGKHDHGALGIGKVVKEGKRLFYPHIVPATTQSPDKLLSLDPKEERRTISALPSPPPAYIGEVVQVSAGMKHSLLLTRDGKVYATGHNQFGQCGFSPLDVTATTAAVPNAAASSPNSASSFLSLNTFTRVSALRHEHIVHVSAGQHHSLFVTADGRVLACGLNQQGQCGPASPLTTTQRHSSSVTPQTSRAFLCVPTPQPLPLPAGFHCVRAVAGFYDTALIGADGRLLWCGGRMRQQPTDGSSGQGSLGAVAELMSGQRVRDVSFGLVHSLILTEQAAFNTAASSNSSPLHPHSSGGRGSARESIVGHTSADSGARPNWY